MGPRWTIARGALAALLVSGALAGCSTEVGLDEFAFECGEDTQCPEGLVCVFPTDGEGNQAEGGICQPKPVVDQGTLVVTVTPRDADVSAADSGAEVVEADAQQDIGPEVITDVTPDTGQPDTAEPDADEPDAAEPDADEPDAEVDASPDVPPADEDSDGVLDADDNCPNVSNAGQEDQDSDDIGDACDDDVDGDGVSNDDDTCELYSNEEQSDGLDSPTSCCGVDCYAVAPEEGVTEMGCFQGVCAPSVCASTHYANPDGPTEGPGVECLKRPGPIWVHPFLGDDDNDGLSEEAPKETLQGAVDAAVEPYTLINLMADTFTVSEQVEIPGDRTGLRIQGVDEGNKKARLTTSPADATFTVMWIRASGVEVANLELRGGATAVHIQGAAEGEDGVTLEDVLLDQVVIEQQKPAAIDGVATPTNGVYATDVKDLTLSGVEVREQEPEIGTGAWVSAVYIHDGKNTRIEGLNVQDVSISPGAVDAVVYGVYLSDLVETSVVDLGIWGVSADLEGAATGLVCHDCVKLTLDTVEVQGISSGVAADAQGVVLQNLAVSATLTGLNLWDITSADGDDTAELPPGGATGLALNTEEGFLAQSDVVIRDLQVRGVTAGEATEALSAAGTQGQARGLLVAAPALLKISQISISDITAALAADVTTGDHRARGVEIASAESVELEQGSLHDIGVYTDALLQDTGVGLLVSGPVSDPVGVQSTILSQIHGEGIRVDDEGSAVGLSYSLTWSVWAGLDPGLTLGDEVLLEMDPQFVDPETGDLHLASESPAIDAGAPSGAFEPNTPGPHFCHEPQHNGARVNMGYYGGTPEATVRPGATASAPEDCDPAPECAAVYLAASADEASPELPCGCYDTGLGAIGDPCVGSQGSCAGVSGQVLCSSGVLGCSAELASAPGDEAYAGGDELCNLNDDDCDGEVDEAGCGLCLDPADAAQIQALDEGFAVALAYSECDQDLPATASCLSTLLSLSEGCSACYAEELFCMMDRCPDACDTGTYGQGTCTTCAHDQLCHLERAKCTSTASPAPHPCETYCQDRLALTDPFHQPVCDGFFDGDITACLATCSAWGAEADVTAPTVACLLDQLAQLQTVPGGLPEGKACSDAGFQGLCADLDGDGQTPLQGDCEPDVSTIKTGGQVHCDGVANDCDDPGEVEGDDLCQEGQQCMNAVGCLDTVSCTAPHWVSPEGTTAWGVIPDADHLESGHLSVTTWIRPDVSPDGHYITSAGRFSLSHDQSGISVVLRFDCDPEADGSPWVVHHAGVHPEPGRWTHLGVTFDGFNLKTYVNGVAVAETAVSEDDAPATMGACEGDVPWYLGRRAEGDDDEVDGPNHFQGALRHVTLWSEALSPTDMAAHVAKGSVPEGKLGSLTGWYPLEDAAIAGPTGALRDRSPYAHHGTWTQEGDDAQTAHTWTTYNNCPDTPIQCQWGANVDPPESHCVDADGDGWSPLEGDCDEGSDLVNPGAAEVCDGVDNDCSGAADQTYAYADCCGDLEAEQMATLCPGADEVCLGAEGCVSGGPCSAVSFAASDVFVEVDALHAWPTDGVTVGAWVYRECAEADDCGGDLVAWDGLQLSMDPQGRLTASVTVGDGDCGQGTVVSVTAGGQDPAAPSAPLYYDVVPQNQWAHVATTWDGKNLEVLLNGAVVATGSIPEVTPLAACPSTLTIGGGQTGILRHVSLFGAALEPGAPHQDLAMGILPVGSSAALIAYWPLDEGAGIHALDRTGHGNNGELSPATPPWAELAGSCVPSGPPTCATDADPTPVFCQDLDGDGLSPFTGDCNDDPATDGAAMAWGADELCDGIDNNCDGFIDQIGPTPPLLSEWMLPFEGCADDTICQGSLGCIQGTPCSSPLFVDDGDDDPSSYVGVDVASDLSMGGAPGATVATWYQRKAQPWYHGWAISTPTLRLRVNGHGLPEAYVRLEDGEEGCTADWQGAISSHNGEVSAPWMDGNWHFVAVTWDGTSLQIWNNAMEAMTLPLTDTPTALESGCDEVTTVGYRLVGPDENVDWADAGDALPAYGTMRHLSLWSAALTPSGLQALAQGNLPGQDLEGYWPLDEGSGDVARDVSGQGRDGVYLGDVTWQDSDGCLPAGDLSCNGSEDSWDPVCKDGDTDQYTGLDGDCDDANPAVNPGAPEVCDGVDNDCDGVADPVSLCCGNGVVDPMEGCDDLNQDDDDGCSAICQPEGLTLDGSLVHHETFADGLPVGAEALDGPWPTGDTDQGTAEVDGRICWQQRSDWTYLRVPGPAALAGDDAFLLEVDVWRPVDVTWSHWQLYPAEASHTDGIYAGLSTHLTGEVVHQMVKDASGDVVFDEALPNTAPGGSWVRLRVHVRRSDGETRVWLNGVYQGVYSLGPDAYTGQDVVLSGGGCAPGVDGCPGDGVQADVCWADLKWYQIACGDGVLDDGEVCDDGNLDSGDGCAEDCSAIGQPLAYYDMEEGLGQTLYNKSPRHSGAFSGTLNYDAQFSADGNLTGGYHLTFDGNQDHARFAEGWEQDGEDVWLAADGFSLALWVNVHELPEAYWGSDHSYFWEDYDQLLNLGDAGYLGLSPYEEGGWNFGFNYDHLDAPYTVYSGLDHPTYVAGEWVHVVGTYDGDWMRLYLNGTEAASQQVGKVQHVYWSNADTDDGALGAGTRGETRYLNGAIDEFSMWDVALGPDLVADLYNGGLPVRADQLGAEAVCGDGVFQPGEACDDGNLVALDGCEPNCTLTVEGDTCASAIYIPTDDFVAVSCPDGPCVQAVVTGSTVGANDAHDVTDDALCPSVDDGAVAGAPDVSYTFDNLEGWSLKTVLEGDFDAVVAIQDGPASVGCDDLGEVCLQWSQGGATGLAPKEPDAAWITVDGYTPEDQGSFTLTLELYACGNGVNDFHMGETCDDGNQVDGDGCSAACVLEAEETPRDCAGVGEISPETGSGLYDIDLDGPLGGPPIQVFCDMETRGGGWTVLTAFDIEHSGSYIQSGFLMNNPRNPDAHNWDDYRLGEHEFTTLMDRSDEVHARCHRDFASSSDDYLFGPIALVRHGHNGLQVGQGTGIVTGRIRGHDIQSEDARYYQASHSYHPHVDGHYITGHTHSEDNFGHYSNKNPDHLCTRSEGETVWMVRRAWCGNGVVEAGETCDDGNADDTDGCPRTCKGFVDATDCMDIQQTSPDAPSGTYVVDPDGPGPGSPAQVWCDMETDGGGWTLCSAQGDAEPTVLGWGDKADEDNWYACHLFGGATTETRFHATDGAESHEWTFSNLDHGAEVLLAPSDDQTAHLNIFKDTATCGDGPYPDNYQVELFSSQGLFGMSTQSAAGCSTISTVPSDASWLSIVSQGAVDKGCAGDHHILPNLGYCSGGYPDVGASFEIYVRTARCGDGVVEGDEACDDDNDDESDGCTSSCETYGSALDCADVLSQAPGAPSGLYSLTTGAAWCDMERHGGGWTLVAVVSDDNQENWTWDNRNYWDTDTTTFGSVAQPHKDFKSSALHDLAFTDLLFVHAPSGVWAAYNQVGDGSGSLADTIGAYGGESIKWDYYGLEPVPGYPLTAGTLTATGKMCTDQLYFNATDQDGSGYEYAYGPSWNANRNSTNCFDDPGIGATLGTGNYGPTDEEQLSMGFGEALELNTGEAGTGENHMQIFVRRPVCGNGVLEGDQICDDGDTDQTDGCTGSCETYTDATDCVDVLEQAPGSPSGVYLIDPDGPEGEAPITVWCDMETDGGGWTRIFAADDVNYFQSDLGYTVDDLSLREASTEAMIGYNNTLVQTLGIRARFPMPETWVEKSPMSWEAEDHEVQAHVNGEAPVATTLRYGWRTFNDQSCGGDWWATEAHGRICLTDTDGPFWNAFNDGSGENCPDSSETFGAVDCDETRQFVIQVRRPSCGNGVVETGEACDDGNQETSDGCTPECTVYDGTARDCLEVLQGSPTSPSGTYLIDPDGAEGQDPYPVWCDMEADGGGWTRIYVADKNNLHSKELDYTITDPLLRTTRASVMLGYTTPQGGPVHGRATLAMPESWVVQAPMRYPNQDETVTVQVEGGAPQESTLRYGWGAFSSTCAHGWNGAVAGRICLKGTEGPYWGGFAYSNTAVDWCESSAKSHNSGAWCDTDTRFAIYVRRAVCGDGVVEGDEPCDDQNPSELDGCTSSCATYADATDCVDVLEQAPGSPSGVYLIDPDGPEGKGPISVYCDMETDGGGWTALINPLNHGQDYMEQFPSTENTVTDYVVDPDKGVSWGTNQVDDLDEIVSSLTVTVPFDEVRIVHSGDYVGGMGKLELLNESEHLFVSADAWSSDDQGQSLTIKGQDIYNKTDVVFEDREDTVSAPGSAELRIGMTGLLGYDYTRRYVKALWFRRASCGNGVLEAGEVCDDANGDNTDGCTTSCGLYGEAAGGSAPVDCLDIRDQAPGATNGIYLVDPDGEGEGEPYEVYCDMEHAGGGWTLVVVTSNDGQNTWTWDNRHYWDADETTFGSLGTHHLDFKSVAHHQVPFTDLLFVHAPSGEWASYNGVGDGEETLAAHIGAYGEEPIYWSATEGYPLTDGTLVAGGSICTDRLYFTAADRDNSPSEASYGPTWNTVNNQNCPFDDPSNAGGLGPKQNNAGLEEDAIGFGQVLGLNTGSALTGSNHMQVLVRRAVCGNGVVEGDEACDGGADCTELCDSLAVSATDCLDLHQKSPSAPSGTYTVDPDGDGGAEPYAVYCDMETGGGGWTLCSEHRTSDPTQLEWGVLGDTKNWYACHLLFDGAVEAQVAVSDGASIPQWTYPSVDLAGGGVDVPDETGTSLLTIYKDQAYCDVSAPDNYQMLLFTTEELFGQTPQDCAQVPEAGNYVISPGAVTPGCIPENQLVPNLAYPCGTHGDLGLTLMLYARPSVCGDGQVSGDEACDDANDDNTDGCTTTCEVYDGSARDCLAILDVAPGAAGGLYHIDPDGDGGADPYPVYCDMDTDGGGWTVVFYQDITVNYYQEDLDYVVTDPALRSTDHQTLIGYVPAAGGAVSNRATFPMPQDWVDMSPMKYRFEDTPVQVRVEGAGPEEKLLRYGYGSFDSGSCGGKWGNHVYGRICIKDTTATFWNGFNYTWGESCETSDHGYNDGRWCGVDDVFVIYTRRSVCGDGVVEGRETCDDQNQDETDGCTSACQSYADAIDCTHVLEQAPGSPNGTYLIDPDGDGGDEPFQVYCDMTADGGGWTRIFVAEEDNYDSDSIAYTLDNLTLREAAVETLMAYTDESGNLSDRARFPMPENWVSKSPMSWEAEDDVVNAWVGDATEPVETNLRYGYASFYAGCDDAWEPEAADAGRICLQDTVGPFWSTFDRNDGDYCSTSEENWSSQLCAEDRRFTIMVRRSSCGNGVVEAGETCDDANEDNADGCTTTCQAYADAVDCADLLFKAPGASSGIYLVDPDGEGGEAPYEVLCDMERDGGGWTLITIHSNDGVHTWTWQNRHYWDTDETTFGSLHDLWIQDLKSPALHDAPMSDMLFVHAPSGVWAAYSGVSDGSGTMAEHMLQYGGDSVKWDPEDGYPLTAGTLEVAGKLCDDRLYFNARDYDAHPGQNTYGPTWNAANNDGCPFDDPAHMVSLGPDQSWSTGERENQGFGSALGLNTGVNSTGENHMQVFVRRPVCGNGRVDTGETCDDQNTDETDGCTSTCQDVQGGVDCLDVLERAPGTPSGLYIIDPDGVVGPHEPTQVWCDMETNGGGWTLCSEQHKDAYTQLEWKEQGSEDNWFACHTLQDEESQLRVHAYNTEYDYDWVFPGQSPVAGVSDGLSTDESAHLTILKDRNMCDYDTPENNYQMVVRSYASIFGVEPEIGCGDEPVIDMLSKGSQSSGCAGPNQIVPNLAYPCQTHGDHGVAFQVLSRRAYCGDGVVDEGEACDDQNDDDTDGCLGGTCEAYGGAIDCTDVQFQAPSAPSGLYTIDPDGDGGLDPFEAWCDMDTDGGGWTRIFVPEQVNYNQDDVGYTLDNAALRQASDEAMIGYNNTLNQTMGIRGRFPMPGDWVIKSPMSWANQDHETSAYINGSHEPVDTTLRYGHDTFNSDCDGDWNNGAHGRICLQGTEGPFWNAFHHSSYDHEYCSASQQNWNNTVCDETRQFVIQVRRSRCGDASVHLGEACDDGNQDETDGCSSSCETIAQGTDCLDRLSRFPDAPSGLYVLDPDGVGGQDAEFVHCDMTADDGGWSRVFMADSDHHTDNPPDWSTQHTGFRQPEMDVLTAYTTVSSSDAQTPWVTHGIVQQYIDAGPWAYVTEDVDLDVRQWTSGGVITLSTTLRFGTGNFNSNCGSAWSTNGSWGRFCILGTEAPFWNKWAIAGGADHCTDSTQNYGAGTCTDARRFGLWTRRTCDGPVPTCVGSSGATFELEDVQDDSGTTGQDLSMESLYGGGPVLIALLSGWCPYCQSQAGLLEQLKAELAGEGTPVTMAAIHSSGDEGDQGGITDVSTYPVLQDTFVKDVWGTLGGGKDDMYIYTPGGVLHAYLPGGPDTDLSTPEGYANVKQVLQEAASTE